ncbi:MAG: hypothetical protein ACFFAS_14915 [Promethearchaeota archaeon]
MGLDIYTGPLTRYYSGNWENIVEKWARVNDVEFKTIRPTNEKNENKEIDPAEILEAIKIWQNSLGKSLEEHLDEPFFWEEGNGLKYETDKPDFECYGALILWAVYSEHPDLNRPLVHGKEWSEDPVYLSVIKQEFKTKYGQLINEVEFWFPVKFKFTFKAEAPCGNSFFMGSSFELFHQLKELNQNTWKASEQTIKNWRKLIDPNNPSLEEKAKFGFSIVYNLTNFSISNKTPMKLDY